MPISKTIQNFLDKHKIKCEAIEHKTVYTAYDKTATLHIKPNIVGKTMAIVFDKKNHALGLIPANKNLNKKKVLKTFNVLRKKAEKRAFKKIDFAKEAWMKKTFKGIDVGATPPFGLLYDLPFFIDNTLMKQTKIIINGGKYKASFKISPANLLKLNSNTIKGSFGATKK
jgi:prolyl-tRNA editing enzyme YbaK/EbsC (Cys-tRNA(Pro) deacylase)